jgi:predicted NBD/HSP70 family sugar kinase
MQKRFLVAILLGSFLIDFCGLCLSIDNVQQIIPAEILSLRRLRGELTVERILATTRALGWDEEDARALLVLSQKGGRPLSNVLLNMIGAYTILRPSHVLKGLPEPHSIPSGVGGIYLINDWDMVFAAMRELEPGNLRMVKIGFEKDERGGSITEFLVPRQMNAAEEELVSRYIAHRMINHMVIYGAEKVLVSDGALYEKIKSFFEPLRGVKVMVKFGDGSVNEITFSPDPHRIAGHFLSYLDGLEANKFKDIKQILVRTDTGNLIVDLMDRAVRQDIKYGHIKIIQRIGNFARIMDNFFESYYGRAVPVVHQSNITIVPQEVKPYPVTIMESHKGISIGIDMGGTQNKAVLVIDGKVVAMEYISSWRFDYQQRVEKEGKERARKFQVDEVINNYILRLIEILARKAGIDLKNNDKIISIGLGWPGQVRDGLIAAPSGAALAIEQPLEEIRDFSHLVKIAVEKKWEIRPQINLEHDNRIYGLGAMVLVDSSSKQTAAVDGVFDRAVVVFGTDNSRADFNHHNRMLRVIGQNNQIVFDMAPPPDTFNETWQVAQAGFGYLSGTTIVNIARRYNMLGINEAKDVADKAAQGDAIAIRVLETVGYYLAMAMPEFMRMNPVKEIFFAGGPMTGKAGEIIVDTANRYLEQLRQRFPLLKDLKLILLRRGPLLNLRSLNISADDANLYIGAIGAAFLKLDGDY